MDTVYITKLFFNSHCEKTYKNREIRKQLLLAVNNQPSEINQMFDKAAFGNSNSTYRGYSPFEYIKGEVKTVKEAVDLLIQNYDDENANIFEILEDNAINVGYFHLVKCECGKFTIREDVALYLKYCKKRTASVFLDGQDQGLCYEPQS